MYRPAAEYYTRVFGLRRHWHDAPASGPTSVGLDFPETDAEVVLHDDPRIPNAIEVHYRVDDVLSSCGQLTAQGCTVRVPPFDIPIGKCAVIKDPFGVTLCVLDMSKGPRKSGSS